jgi:SAM-dependent methyltransferase
MERWKYFDIVHRDHVFWNPLSEAKVDELISLLRPAARGRVLDIACGAGEFLRRVVTYWQAEAVGVDASPSCVALARDRLGQAGLGVRTQVLEMDGAAYEAPPESFDVSCCLGASWIWRGHAGTLAALSRWTKPGGMVLVGEPYWRKEPTPAYLEASGTTREGFTTHAKNVTAGTAAGLRFLHSIVSSEDDWDRYEGLHCFAAERYARANPDDPDVPELLTRTAQYYNAYLQWGRSELGWATYLFLKP